ncbi:MAG: HAD-IB family phosphatase [Oscillospiraceae bacterium]|nr:HAD-IB family phosphatase [Oscillospiraceae bacterium]
MYDKMLFVDFDGTITSQETLEGSMRLCIPAELYMEKERELTEGKCTISSVLHLAFSVMPSSRFGEIMDYVRTVPIRPGFLELLVRMREMGIPVVVISGGLQPYVEEKLAPYREYLLDVYSVALDTSGEFMRLRSDYDDGTELIQKAKIMEKYNCRHAMCIGDSYSDVEMARASRTVFARDTLAQVLTAMQVPYHPWEDFFDVERVIKSSK